MTSTPYVTAGRANGRRQRPRGYAPWSPHADTLRLVEEARAVLDDYAEQLPLTLRQVYYVLVGREALPKTEHAYERLGEHMSRARRAQLIPFSAIRDDGVSSHEPFYYLDPADLWQSVTSAAERYRLDRQDGQPNRLEVWCEAAGMVPQLARVCAPYSVPVHSAGGFVSATTTHALGDRTAAWEEPLRVLHLGDLDPSGESIYAALVADAAAFAAHHGGDLRGERVALTAEQVHSYDLPTAPPKRSDLRGGWREDDATCQLEALPPDRLAEVVEAALARHRDEGVYRRVLARERRERDDLRARLHEALGDIEAPS